ncbi:hypothetical protein H2200_001301 [Cladophialophora chaetospira]|uniref:Uncharacterized protein n=1 Tax=Cladophialophora chaetospira TaxID=386627 RepID=A0AA38XKM2_9EURO|nr:hypothetical protein H2200_001301 [Cladophialophora chaetospira]
MSTEQEENDNLERFSTANTKKKYNNLYPTEGAGPVRVEFLDKSRQSASEPGNRYAENRKERKAASADNARAAQELNEASVDKTDFAYPEGDPKRKP